MIFGGFTPLTLIDFPGKIACIVFTIGCNFRCPYCHNPELVDETVEVTFTEEYVLTFLEKRKKMYDGIVITGGEPTMHEDLIDFIRAVKEHGFQVKLDTNGTNPKLLKKLMDEKLVDYVAMDMKAPLGSYYKTVGRPVDTAALRESIDALMQGSVPYEFRTTVVKALLTPDDIENITHEIEGASQYYLQKFVPNNILNPQFKRKVTYTDEEFLDFQKSALKHVAYCGIR
jgi:pyruvate formate lyase activating enzyme